MGASAKDVPGQGPSLGGRLGRGTIFGGWERFNMGMWGAECQDLFFFSFAIELKHSCRQFLWVVNICFWEMNVDVAAFVLLVLEKLKAETSREQRETAELLFAVQSE